MISKRIKIPIYEGVLFIHKGPLSEVEEKYGLMPTNGLDAICFIIDNKHHVAFDKDLSAGVIAHEAMHVVSNLFLSKGIMTDIENDEPQCYLLGWIVDQITNFLNKDDFQNKL